MVRRTPRTTGTARPGAVKEEIAGPVACGLSTREISARLFVSEHPVQNHPRNVFEKVGVRSRRELVKRLFFDGFYPSLFG